MDDQLAKHKKTFEEGSFIFTEEGAGDKFYIIKEGTVELLKNTDTGTSHIGSLGPGEVLGELALVSGNGKRSASARAGSDVTCLEFDEKQFDRLLQENDQFRQTMINLLTNRLRKTSDNLAEVLELRDKLHEAAVLLLYFMLEHNWFDHSKKRVPTDLPISDFSSFFQLRKKDLAEILENPSMDDLTELSFSRRESIQRKSESVVEDIIRSIEFESTSSADTDGEDARLRPESLRNNLESIHSHLDNRDEPLDDVQVDEIRDQLTPLEDVFEGGDAIDDEKLRKEIETYVDEINEKLSELIEDD